MHKDPRNNQETTHPEWPQGFDIRAEHAEQQELLHERPEQAPGHRETTAYSSHIDFLSGL